MRTAAYRKLIDYEITDQAKTDTAFPLHVYKMIFDSSSTALLLTDQTYRVLTANSMLQDFTGYSLEELQGLESWIEIMEEVSQARIAAWISANHHSEKSPRHFESSIICKDQEKKQVYVSVSHIQEQNFVLISLTDITELKKNERMLYHKAFHDHLTGLPNKSLFMEVLTLAIHRAKRNRDYFFSVLFLDIDHFKDINDSLGHHTGDRILAGFAQTVKKCLRNTDIMSRMGGDEFAVILDGIQNIEDTSKVVDRIFKKLKKPLEINKNRIQVQVSIGVVSDCRHYDYPEDIIRDADAAMYGAKDGGRSGYQIFEHKMHCRFKHIQEMEKAMKKALENEEFILYYQPIVSLRNKRVVSFEALMRWERPGLGLIPAVRFIPVAEKTRLILSMSKWILTQACSQMRTWQTSYPALAKCNMCVNLSFNQLQDPAMEKNIRDALETTGLPARHLQLEITEARCILARDTTVQLLKRLHQTGIKIMVDDFGTGYASLNFLHRYPLDFLKLDRSLIESLDSPNPTKDTEIVETIISLAHNLKLKVVAEGVEKAAQQKFLSQMNCNYAQGYLYFRPMPPELINPEYLETFLLTEE